MKRISLYLLIITGLLITLLIHYGISINMQSEEQVTEKYLQNAFHNDYLKRISAKKVKLKFLTSGINDHFNDILFQQIKKNLKVYSEITGIDFEISDPQKPSNIPQLVIILTSKNPAEITLLPSVRKLLYPDEKLGEKSKYPDGYQVLKDKNKLFIMDLFYTVEHATSLGVFIMNLSHESVVDNEPRAFKELNLAFYRFFSSYTRNNNLPSLASKGDAWTSLTPLDKAYLKAIYSERIHTGMLVKEAKKVVKEKMLENLQSYYGESEQ